MLHCVSQTRRHVESPFHPPETVRYMLYRSHNIGAFQAKKKIGYAQRRYACIHELTTHITNAGFRVWRTSPRPRSQNVHRLIALSRSVKIKRVKDRCPVSYSYQDGTNSCLLPYVLHHMSGKVPFARKAAHTNRALEISSYFTPFVPQAATHTNTQKACHVISHDKACTPNDTTCKIL